MTADTAPGTWTWQCGHCPWDTGRHRDPFTAQALRAQHLTSNPAHRLPPAIDLEEPA